MASKTFTATWLGDEDPLQQIITEGGVRFIKGEPTKVPHDLEFNGIKWASQIKGNPMFAIDEKADVIESDEDEQPEEEGTERAALRAELNKRGIKYGPNSGIATLRDKLSAAVSEEDK